MADKMGPRAQKKQPAVKVQAQRLEDMEEKEEERGGGERGGRGGGGERGGRGGGGREGG